jgi:uncharacterized protein YjbI with pentapeptide repeats
MIRGSAAALSDSSLRLSRLMSRPSFWTFLAACMLFASATAARADIYQWTYNSNHNIIRSSTLCPDGAGVSAASGANLANRNLTQAYLYAAKLDHATLTGTNLTNAYLYVAAFNGANLQGTELGNANLGYANLTGADLTSADLTNATIALANFSGSNLAAGQLYGTADYKSLNLLGIQLSGNNMIGWNFVGQNLHDATVQNANLTNANMQNAYMLNLRGSGVNFQGADLTGASLNIAHLENASFQGANLTGVNLYNATFTDANFSQATITGVDFTYSTITAPQLYSTASYQAHNLQGISLSANNLNGWSFKGQNLTGANLLGGDLTDADLTNATIAGANLGATWLSDAQLYSTASYQARNLRGVGLSSNTMANWDLSGQNLSGANLSMGDLTNAKLTGTILTGARLANATLTGADLTGADLRGATGVSLDSANTHNTILPGGTINGLSLGAGETLTVQNYAGNIPITVLGQMAMGPGASLAIVLDGQPWGSTISFAPGISVSLAGELDLTPAAGVALGDLIGDTFQLFDWSSVSPDGRFQVVADSGWDLSRLYTSGQVTFVGQVPEPCTFAMLGMGALGLFAYAWRRRAALIASAAAVVEREVRPSTGKKRGETSMQARIIHAVTAILSLVVLSAGTTAADTIAIANYSFENDVVADGQQTLDTTNWSQVSGIADTIVTRNPTKAEFTNAAGDNGALPSPARGSQALYNPSVKANDCACLYNTATGISIPATFDNGDPIGNGHGGLQPNVIYNFTVSIGTALNTIVADGNDGFALGIVDVRAGSAFEDWEFPFSQLPRPGTFKDFAGSFKGSDVINPRSLHQGDTLTLMIVLGAGAWADNVRLSISEPVPEPSTLVLLTSGMLGLLAYLWRKQRAVA